MKDERLVSKMEGKTNFSKRLWQFDGLTWLTLTSICYDRSAPLIMLIISRRLWVVYIYQCHVTQQTHLFCRVTS